MPLVERPFLAIADEIGACEEDVLAAVRALLQDGTMRSLGVFVNYDTLGYRGLLCGLSVPEAGLAHVAEALNSLPYVTHNYLRGHTVNVWCTAILKGKERKYFEKLLERLGYPFVALESVLQIKLAPSFADSYKTPEDAVLAHEREYSNGPELPPDSLSILSCAQKKFSLTAHPFDEAASELGLSSAALLERLCDLKNRGVLRRVGASLHHRRAGYAFNALLALEPRGPCGSDATEEISSAVTPLPWASHCYIRRAVRSSLPFDWPYTLYIMIHARSAKELTERAALIREAVSPKDGAILPTLREFKKERFIMDYEGDVGK